MNVNIDLSQLPELMNEKFYQYRQNTERYQVFYGSAGSSKSVSIGQTILVRILSESNHRILIVRKVAKSLKRSVFQLFKDLISQWGLNDIFNVNNTDFTITCDNGSQLLFTGLDDSEKIKSIAGISSIWCEEATELLSSDFEQLDLRLRGQTKHPKIIYLTFNPVSSRSWIKKRFFDVQGDNTLIVHSTFKDNKFLDNEYKQVLENMINTDERLYNIYALGKWGEAKGLIYPDYEVIEKLPEDYELRRYGLDFGFQHPISLCEVRIIGQNVYANELYYESETITDDLIRFMNNSNVGKKDQIRCDSAEPDRIEQLKRAGYNAVPAKKNVQAGIDKVKSYKLHITADSINAIKELESYRWATDKNGDSLDVPVKTLDDFCDSLRYSLFVDEAVESRIIPTSKSYKQFDGFDYEPSFTKSRKGRHSFDNY